MKESLDTVYDDSSTSMETVKNWLNKVQRSRTSASMSHTKGPENGYQGG